MVSPQKISGMEPQLTRTKTIWEELSKEPMKAAPPIDFSVNVAPREDPDPNGPNYALNDVCNGAIGIIMIPGQNNPRVFRSNGGKGEEAKGFHIKAYSSLSEQGIVDDSHSDNQSKVSLPPKIPLQSNESAKEASRASERGATSIGMLSRKIAASISKGAKKSSKATSKALKATARIMVVKPAKMVSQGALGLLKKVKSAFKKN